MRFANIEKLRGFAALSVLLRHIIALSSWDAFPVRGPFYWFRCGWLGVDLFYVISGLVITASALGLYQSDPAGYRRAYWERRFSRILPLYLLTLIVCLVALVPDILSLKADQIVLHVGTHLLFIHNFFPKTHGSINGANWSVAVEMQFYLMIILLIPWIARTKPLRILVTFTLISWVYRAIVVLILRLSHAGDYQGIPLFKYFLFASQLPGTLDEFGYGIFLCRLLMAKDPGEIGLGRLQWLLTCRWTVIGVSAILVPTAVVLTLKHTVYWGAPLMTIFFRTGIGLAASFFILAAVRLPMRFAPIIGRPLDWLGDISYGIYLWHLLVIVSLHKLSPVPGWSFACRVIVCVLALSAISWHFMEKPFMRRFRQPKPPQPPATVKSNSSETRELSVAQGV